MTAVKFMLGLLVSLATCANAQPRLVRQYGVPPPASPGTTTTWDVYTCPDAADCTVTVGVAVNAGVCTFTVPAFIDRNSNRKRQQLIWVLDKEPAGYEISFKNQGIEMKLGSGDVRETLRSQREHRKQVIQQSRLFLLYDILVEYKDLTTGTVTSCSPHGPAIINRG